MTCEREAILKLLVKLERDLAHALSTCGDCRKKAMERLEIYKTELEDLLAQEPTFSR